MKTLEQWWRYVDGEQPEAREAASKAYQNLSSAALQALNEASRLITRQARISEGEPIEERVRLALDNHYDALKELSLALCPALERMRERVRPVEAKPYSEPVRVKAPEFDSGKAVSARIAEAAELLRAPLPGQSFSNRLDAACGPNMDTMRRYLGTLEQIAASRRPAAGWLARAPVDWARVADRQCKDCSGTRVAGLLRCGPCHERAHG